MTSEENKLINVLLIDDDEDDYFLTKCLFEDFKDNSYKLEWTTDVAEALAAMKAGKHDIYLLDYRLGNHDGLNILREAIAGGCTAPILLLTGQTDKEVDIEAMQAGAADYLIKGQFDAPLLERVIRYSIQHFRWLEKIHSSEKRFRSVIQSASDAIFLVNEEGNVILWNSAAEKIFGYSEKEIVGKSAIVLMGEKYAFKASEVGFKETMEMMASHTGNIIQATGRRKDHSEFPVELSGSVWKTSEGLFYTAIIRDITERHQANESLKASEERYRDLFENANDTIYLHDLTGKFISVNQTGERMFGYSREEAKKLHISEIIAPESLEKAKMQIAAKISGQSASNYELDCIRKDGKRVSFEVNSRVIYDGDEPIAIQGIARDISDRKKAQAELDRLYNFSNDLLATIAFDGKLLHINPAWEKILGYQTAELLGKSLNDITHSEDIAKNQSEAKKLHKGNSISYESRLLCEDGSFRWISWNATPIVSEQLSYVVGRNITERKIAERVLEHNALFDTLTNLPNRTQFMNHLQKAIQQYEEDSTRGFAMLFLDLDRFKIINDGLGHLIGDKLLIAIADRIKTVLRPGDIVARLGGDEFTLLIHSVKEVSDATLVAERIQQHLSNPFKLDNYEVFTSASIGIIVSDETKRTPEDFLRDADSAMYRAKDSGKARYEIFDQEMYTHNMNLLQVETDLRKAIERNEFRVFYQPIVCLQTGELKEFEALIRWEHPQYGLVSPIEFVGIAEETGLIIQIGEWILEEACRQTKIWQQTLPFQENLSISVNLSSKQLMHPALKSQVKDILAKTKLKHKYLKLEVTESIVMENADTALEVLNELTSLGISISTDDFGTGYSSLSYLHQFPFKRIKIDRSFIGKMDTDLKSEAIVRTILMLADNLGFEVVAEGIENINQLKKLQALGCAYGQGYLFSKPVSETDAAILLKSAATPDRIPQQTYVFAEFKAENVIQIDSLH